MKKKIILISGRPDSGKTDLILLYANQYPKTTLFLVEEYDKEAIYKRGLNKNVAVIHTKEFDNIDLEKFDTVCIDYVELFKKPFLDNVIECCLNKNIRIIAVSMMRRDFKVNNIFEGKIN